VNELLSKADKPHRYASVESQTKKEE
jgi:hypothetical protein